MHESLTPHAQSPAPAASAESQLPSVPSAASAVARLQRLAHYFAEGTVPAPDQIHELTAGLCGRVLRGKSESCFEKLSNDPSRQIILLLDGEGVSQLLGKRGEEICLSVLGYTAEHAARMFKLGSDGRASNELRVVVFEAAGGIQPATWEHMITLAAVQHPELESRLKAALPELTSERFSFTELEQQYGVSMHEVDAAGPAHPKYMTAERFAASEGTVADVRAFLYFTLHLRENFTGTGWLQMDDGSRGPREYAALNPTLEELGPHVLAPIGF